MQDGAHFTETQLVRTGFYNYLKSRSVSVFTLYTHTHTHIHTEREREQRHKANQRLHQRSILSTGTADFFGLNHYTTYRATFRQDQPGFPFSSDTGITLSAPSDWPASRTSEWEVVSRFSQSNDAGTKSVVNCVKSDFRREVDENCVLMGYNAASSGNSLPTFPDTYRPNLEGSKIQEETSLSVNLGSIRGG